MVEVAGVVGDVDSKCSGQSHELHVRHQGTVQENHDFEPLPPVILVLYPLVQRDPLVQFSPLKDIEDHDEEHQDLDSVVVDAKESHYLFVL